MNPDKLFLRERTPEVNYLNERLKLSFSIEPKMVQYLPKVSKEELATRQEKYAVLLGSKKVINNEHVHVHVSFVLTIPEELQLNQRYYKEGQEIVEEINIPATKQFVDTIKEYNPEFKEEDIVGNIHTHPILPSELGGVSGAQPSEGDIEFLVESYESEEIDTKEPFIFAIAAPDEEGETTYSFYRLIKTIKGYEVRHVD